MKNLYKIKIVFGVLILAILAVSCVEGLEFKELGDGGETWIKLNPASSDGFFLKVAEPTDQPQTFDLLDIRKDASSVSAQNTSTTVLLEFDLGILTAYNTANGTDFIPIPEADYSTVPAASGGNITVTFAPGDFAQKVSLTIPNAFNLDPANQYAMGYRMQVTSGGVLSTSSPAELVVQVLPKNLYDGVYEVTAISPMIDVTSDNLVGEYPFDFHLITTGAHSVDTYGATYIHTYGHVIYVISGDYLSRYGSFSPQLQFNPDGSGEIIGATNYYGNPASNTRGMLLDDTQTWSWDPVTRNIRIKYHMTMTSAVPDPPHIRTTFDELWTYKGTRD